MKAYKIFKSSLKVRKIEKVLNKLDAQGYQYVDMFTGRGFLFPRMFIVAVVK